MSNLSPSQALQNLIPAPEQHTRVAILGASFVTSNFGVFALADGSVKCVLSSCPNAEIYFLDYDRRSDVYELLFDGSKIEIPLINLRFSKKFFLPNNIALLLLMAAAIRLLPICSLREKVVQTNSILEKLDKTNLVLSIAGGDSFSDIYGMRRLIYMVLPQILAIWMNKRLVLLPQTLGPFKSRTARWIARYILSRADTVFSRDQAGVTAGSSLIGSSGNQRKVRFSYDVGFLLSPSMPRNRQIQGLSEVKGERIRVGLNVSGLLFMGGYTGKNDFGLKARYDQLIYRLIESLIRENDAEVLLVPHVFGSEGESDSSVCQRIYDELHSSYPGGLGLAAGAYSHSEIKYVIGGCDFFIGSRMHACIAALSQEVPTAAIAYSDKFTGVLESIGVGEIVIDPRKMGEDGLVAEVKRLFAERAGIRKQLVEVMPGVRQKALHFLDEFLA